MVRPLNESKDCQDYARLSRRVTESLTKLSNAMAERSKLEAAMEKADTTIVSARDALSMAESNLSRWQNGEDYSTILQDAPIRRRVLIDDEEDEED